MVSDEAVAILRQERIRLEQKRDEIDLSIRAISALLGPFSLHVNEMEHRLTGLRESIRKALAASESGLRPRDVVYRLEASGFCPAPGKTPLKIRVVNELARMAKEGRVVRGEGGLYSVR